MRFFPQASGHFAPVPSQLSPPDVNRIEASSSERNRHIERLPLLARAPIRSPQQPLSSNGAVQLSARGRRYSLLASSPVSNAPIASSASSSGVSASRPHSYTLLPLSASHSHNEQSKQSSEFPYLSTAREMRRVIAAVPPRTSVPNAVMHRPDSNHGTATSRSFVPVPPPPAAAVLPSATARTRRYTLLAARHASAPSANHTNDRPFSRSTFVRGSASRPSQPPESPKTVTAGTFKFVDLSMMCV